MPGTTTLRCWLPFALWLLLVGGIIACADRGGLRGFLRLVYDFPGGDKAGHIFLIGTLTFLLNHALAGRTVAVGKCRVQLGGIIIAAVMTVEEVSQIWIPSRTFDLLDLAANYTGVLCAGWLTRRFTRRALSTVK